MEKKKNYKITQISKYYYPFLGGLEFVVKQISEMMSNNGYEVNIIACSQNLKTVNDKVNNIPVKRCCSLFEFKSNPISPGLIWELSKVDTDILHYHHPYIFAVIAHYIARPKYKKLVVTYHGDIKKHTFIMKFFNPIYEFFLKQVDKIHVLALDIITNSSTLNELKLPEHLYKVIPFGIDRKLFDNYDSNKIQDIKNNYKSKKLILFVGRISYMKGLEFLIKAMKSVREDSVLLVIGKGPLKESLEKLSVSENLKDRVIFVGEVEQKELVNYYHSCDVFVLPSVTEPFGIVQLEAMVCGKPVINTKLDTAINFASIHNETGLTVAPENPGELAEAINTLLSDNNLRKQFGENARKRVEEIFSIDKTKKELISFYDELLNAPDVNQ